jgi:hypothetical protein
MRVYCDSDAGIDLIKGKKLPSSAMAARAMRMTSPFPMDRRSGAGAPA